MKLKDATEKALRFYFNQMQETAFANPILKSEGIQSAILTGKFSKAFKFTEHWLISICLTVSPTDDNSSHFWATSLALTSISSGKPKSRFLWTGKEIKIAKDVLKLALEDVGLVNEGETNSITFHGYRVALHAHKNLSDFERSEILKQGVINAKP